METKTTARLCEYDTRQLLRELSEAMSYCEKDQPAVALACLRSIRRLLLPAEVEMGDPRAARIANLETDLRIAQRRIDELREAASAEEVTP